MKSEIIIEDIPLQVIYEDATKTFPNECCGFLFGHESNNRVITFARPVVNSKEGDQKRRFEISPFDYMIAENLAIEKNLQLLGIYHSHPNHPAIASVHDLAKALPFFSYVIVSVLDGEIDDVKSWKLLDEERKFEEEKVNIYKTTFN